MKQILITLLVAASMCACSESQDNSQTQKDKDTVYVVIKQESVKPDTVYVKHIKADQKPKSDKKEKSKTKQKMKRDFLDEPIPNYND